MSKLLYGNGGLREIPEPVEQSIVEASVGGELAIEFTADRANASPTLSNATNATLLAVGDKVLGAVTTGTIRTITAIVGTTITLDGNADNTAAGVNMVAVRASGIPASAIVILFTNDDIAYPAKDVVAADLDEATFDGYAASDAVVWSPSFNNLNRNVLVTGDKKQFRCTGPTVADSVYGAAVVSADKLTLYQLDLFLDPVTQAAAPVGFEKDGDALDYVPLFSLI